MTVTHNIKSQPSQQIRHISDSGDFRSCAGLRGTTSMFKDEKGDDNNLLAARILVSLKTFFAPLSHA